MIQLIANSTSKPFGLLLIGLITQLIIVIQFSVISAQATVPQMLHNSAYK